MEARAAFLPRCQQKDPVLPDPSPKKTLQCSSELTCSRLSFSIYKALSLSPPLIGVTQASQRCASSTSQSPPDSTDVPPSLHRV